MTDRLPERMWRVHQRAHRMDRNKKNDNRAARGRSWKGER